MGRRDFLAAQRAITPASHRSAAAHARPLAPATAPCLSRPLGTALARLSATFPPAQQCLMASGERQGGGSRTTGPGPGKSGTAGLGLSAGPSEAGVSGACASTGGREPAVQFFSMSAESELDDYSSDDDDQVHGVHAGDPLTSDDRGSRRGKASLPRLLSAPSSWVQRPRMLVCGPEGAGQHHLAPALLYALEGLPVHAIGLPSLLSDPG